MPTRPVGAVADGSAGKFVVKRFVVIGLAVMAMTVSAMAPAIGNSGLEGRWHRDNYGVNHEVLICNSSQTKVTCRFMAIPEPTAGPPLEESLLDGPASASAMGRFVGEIVEPEDCPDYAGDAWSEFCGTEALVIAQGEMTMRVPWRDEPHVFQETIAVHPDGRMMLSWDDPNPYLIGFYCPRYRSYDLALGDNQCFDADGVEFP